MRKTGASRRQFSCNPALDQGWRLHGPHRKEGVVNCLADAVETLLEIVDEFVQTALAFL